MLCHLIGWLSKQGLGQIADLLASNGMLDWPPNVLATGSAQLQNIGLPQHSIDTLVKECE